MPDWLKFLLGVMILCLVLSAIFIGFAAAVPWLYEYFGWH